MLRRSEKKKPEEAELSEKRGQRPREESWTKTGDPAIASSRGDKKNTKGEGANSQRETKPTEN